MLILECQTGRQFGHLLTASGAQKTVGRRPRIGRGEEPLMRGKQVLMESLIAHGVEYIFGNPGTTESPILDALLDYPQLRYVVALHEGVALGAASYYALTSGKPAVVNIHVAPGLDVD